jgi:antitoxin (DNA-binding transcriptional repressor) of toxin-antitoxin stability system
MAVIMIHEAKTTLSRLLARVEAGEEIILARGKLPVAKLVPFQPPAKKRRFGALRGTISVGPEFFDALPEQELEVWE